MRDIIINNEKQFYKRLFLYKTLLYKNVNFKSDIDNEELQAIVTALNIKKRFKRIEYIYDYCCNRIDKFYEGKNLCQFQDDKCILHRVPNCKYKNGCCRICKHQSSKGCTTRNLSCKLFYCDKVKSGNELLKFSDLKILKLLTLRQRLICFENYFTDEKTFLRELKIGMLIPHSIGIVTRMMENSIYTRKHNKQE